MPAGPDKVLNPITKRYIKIGSQTYRKLVKDGAIVIDANPANAANAAANANKVQNPKTGRWIKINSQTYKDLVKQGIVFGNNLNNNVENNIENNKKKRSCKNDSSYIYLLPTNDIPDDDLFVTPSGHCFSISEMIDWVNSDMFENKNPYDSNSDMFDLKNKKTWSSNPELIKTIQEYINKKLDDSVSISKVLKQNIDVLWKIGDTGRVCRWDYLYSFEKDDSSAFEYSINKIGELSTMISKLQEKEKEKILDFNVGNLSINNIIESANNGSTCIHGIGNSLIYMFIYLFNLVNEHYNIDVDFDKIGFCFLNKSTKQNPEDTMINFSSNIVFRYNTNIVHRKLFRSLDSVRNTYDFKECNNEAFIASFDSVDEWTDVPTWRRIKIDDACFDLFFLIRMIEDQLCSSKSYNPNPKYPTNPFNNKPFTIVDLIEIRRRIRMTSLDPPPALKLFLSSIMHLWSDDKDYINSNEWREAFISLYEKNLRYKRQCFDKTISDILTTLDVRGYWVPKEEAGSKNEVGLYTYLDTLDSYKFNKVLHKHKAKEQPDSYYIRFIVLNFTFVVVDNYKKLL